MNIKTLTFDIETVPLDFLGKAQYEEYKKNINTLLKKRFPNNDYSLSDLKYLRNLARSVSPYLGKICVIGLHYKDSSGNIQQEALYHTNEETLLKKFWSYLEQFNGLFISFNGLNFDAPFILKRSMYYKIKPTNNKFLDFRRYSTKNHFDVKLVLSDWDKYATGSLDLITNFLGIDSPKDGNVVAANVYDEYKKGNLKNIAEYCLKDVEATYQVYDIIKDYIHNPFINKNN